MEAVHGTAPDIAGEAHQLINPPQTMLLPLLKSLLHYVML
jgi:isocitrate/isopropylmalate dehydrogenase